MLILLPVVKSVLAIDALCTQSGEELDSLAIVGVQVDVVDFALHTGVTDGEMDVVDIAAVLVLVVFLDHVFLVEFSEGVVEVGKHLVKLASDTQVLAVAFYGVIKKMYLV